MDNLFLTPENLYSNLRQNLTSKNNIRLITQLKDVDNHDCKSKTLQYKILEKILQMLLRGSINTPNTIDNDEIFSCIILITHLQEQQKLPRLSELQFANLWQWLLEQYECIENNMEAVCKIITTISNLFVVHFEYDKYILLVLQMILKYLCFSSTDVLLITALKCLNTILITFKQINLSNEQRTAFSGAGYKLLQLYYGDAELIAGSSNITPIILYTFKTLHEILALYSNFAYQYTDELLGLSKAYFNFGVNAPEVTLLKPLKVYISKQAQYESAEDIESAINSEKAQNSGGKTPKTRKPRSILKNTYLNDFKANNCSLENRCSTLAFDIKVNESEVSEPENASNHILFDRNRNAKIRLASINLVGSITRILDRKTLFGYWYTLFPSETANSIDNLLHIGQHDPNLRCRHTALQVCTHILCGSKAYLSQAEINVKKCPTTFVPFSVSLGYTVLAFYRTLTTILSSESSLPVLTQALKCLAVLVQASTFTHFEKGFVKDFIKDVKPLVYHRDGAVQVSALMVLEFLVALPETTCDIVDAIGVPQDTARKKMTNLQRICDDKTADVDIKEFIEFEESDENNYDSTKDELFQTQCIEENSWLLKRVLHNLKRHDKMLPPSVRIESLQVLIAMSSRFSIIKPYLTLVSEVLLYSLKDILPDVRLYAARCVDACAYQISRFLLNNEPYSEAEIRECNKFWLNMVPFIMSRIRRDSEEITTVRITLCDALSNIGSLMFESIPHCSQINLLSFLSGVSSDSAEESLVRAAGARALAVFALFPSLGGDLVFIENTSELILLLAKDSNLLVRVKSFWALGNISDALIGKETEIIQFKKERISDDLLFRLINAATAACSDNDKVRCNAVRTLGNLLRLLNDQHFNIVNIKFNWCQIFATSIFKLSDCIRSSGSAKVKWNTCYAISNLMRNPTIFQVVDLSWQGILFPVLCHVIVHHTNFKVRINASLAILNITERRYFGSHYEHFWSSVLEAIEQSYNLENFYEYNHRDSLQEQLCLALSHIIGLAINNDLSMLKKHILPRAEIIHNTWERVLYRMVPEKAAPLLSCPISMFKRINGNDVLSLEQKKVLIFFINLLSTEKIKK